MDEHNIIIIFVPSKQQNNNTMKRKYTESDYVFAKSALMSMNEIVPTEEDIISFLYDYYEKMYL